MPSAPIHLLAIRLLLIASLAVACSSCDSRSKDSGGSWIGVPPHRFVFSTLPPNDTSATNKARNALGLRLIDANGWFFYGMKTFEDGTKELVWKSSTDGYECKKVAYASGGGLSWEEDYYYTGRTFQRMNDPEAMTCWEFLTFHYDYVTKTGALSYSGQDKQVLALSGIRAQIDDGFESRSIVPELTFGELKALRDRIIAYWVAAAILPSATVTGADEVASTADELKDK